ncbi:hypothetical protein EJ110_NYTH04311 [Nymphaea thermarum]|nr:hypothetical protein EJ110_NYTH04311 [Nymphaea thermarum]
MNSHDGSLEVNVISAEGLSFPIGTIGRNAFVVVGTDSCNRCSTSTDRDGGAYPSWNEKFSLPFRPETRSLDVDVRCKTALGEKAVGRWTIPASDIYEVPLGYLHFLSYRLHDKEGRRNGIINLSVKVITRLPERCLQPSAPLFPLSGMPKMPAGYSDHSAANVALPHAQRPSYC